MKDDVRSCPLGQWAPARKAEGYMVISFTFANVKHEKQ